MGKQKRDFSPPWNSKRSCSNTKVLNWLWSRESRERMSAPCTQLWAPLVRRRQNQSLWCTTTTPTTGDVDVPNQMRGRTPSKAERWPLAVFYNILDLAGVNARILFKEHQQQPGGKSCSSWQRSWGQNTWRGKRPRQSAQGGQQQNQPSQQQTQRQRQCRSERAVNGTKPRTPEMPQFRLW